MYLTLIIGMANLGYGSTMTIVIVITTDCIILKNYPHLIIEVFKRLGGKALLPNGTSIKQHIMDGIS